MPRDVCVATVVVDTSVYHKLGLQLPVFVSSSAPLYLADLVWLGQKQLVCSQHESFFPKLGRPIIHSQTMDYDYAFRSLV